MNNGRGPVSLSYLYHLLKQSMNIICNRHSSIRKKGGIVQKKIVGSFDLFYLSPEGSHLVIETRVNSVVWLIGINFSAFVVPKFPNS